MKKLILLITLITILCLTSCTSSDRADVLEFIDKYNDISETSISSENLSSYKSNDQINHRLVLDKNLVITLATNIKNEIISAIITTNSENFNEIFFKNSVYTLMVITDSDLLNAEKTIREAYTSKKATIKNTAINLNKDNLQTSIIIKLDYTDEEPKHTLKELIKTDNY